MPRQPGFAPIQPSVSRCCRSWLPAWAWILAPPASSCLPVWGVCVGVWCAHVLVARAMHTPVAAAWRGLGKDACPAVKPASLLSLFPNLHTELPEEVGILWQAEARAHRQGVQWPVNVYFLCVRERWGLRLCLRRAGGWPGAGASCDGCGERLVTGTCCCPQPRPQVRCGLQRRATLAAPAPKPDPRDLRPRRHGAQAGRAQLSSRFGGHARDVLCLFWGPNTCERCRAGKARKGKARQAQEFPMLTAWRFARGKGVHVPHRLRVLFPTPNHAAQAAHREAPPPGAGATPRRARALGRPGRRCRRLPAATPASRL